MRDTAFETLLASMVGRLADAAPDAIDAALTRALAEFCRSFALAGAGLLERSAEPPYFVLTAGACEGSSTTLRELVESWPALELERLFRLLPRSLHFAIDPAAADDRFERIRGELGARSFGVALCKRLALAGAPQGALILVAGEGASFSPALIPRLRLVADTLALALALRGRPYPAGVLTDQQMRAFERSNLLAVIERCDWRLQGEHGAARALGLSPSTLRDRLRSFGIQRPR